VSPLGSNITQDAAVLNVQSTFGWVTNAEDLVHAIRPIENGSSIGDH